MGSIFENPSHFGLPSAKGKKATRNFMPAGLTLDTDSEINVSKIHLRQNLANASTTRNIRNRTIDVPQVSSELHNGNKKNKHYSNLSKIQSARKAGSKKVSLPNALIGQDTHGGMSSKPTLLVENSAV